MAAINDEIKRLDMLKLGNKKARSRSRTVSLVSSEAKCVAKECRYTGINTNNKTAVGVCRLCGYSNILTARRLVQKIEMRY